MKQLLFIVSIILSGHNLSKLQSAKPKISFLIAEREYQTIISIPEFAESKLAKDYRLAFCHAENEGNQRHILNNSEEIANADLLFVSIRRRAFSKETMHAISKHISSGKSVIGIRTASHAFQLRKEKLLDGHQEWPEWDSERDYSVISKIPPLLLCTLFCKMSHCHLRLLLPFIETRPCQRHPNLC